MLKKVIKDWLKLERILSTLSYMTAEPSTMIEKAKAQAKNYPRRHRKYFYKTFMEFCFAGYDNKDCLDFAVKHMRFYKK